MGHTKRHHQGGRKRNHGSTQAQHNRWSEPSHQQVPGAARGQQSQGVQERCLRMTDAHPGKRLGDPTTVMSLGHATRFLLSGTGLRAAGSTLRTVARQPRSTERRKRLASARLLELTHVRAGPGQAGKTGTTMNAREAHKNQRGDRPPGKQPGPLTTYEVYKIDNHTTGRLRKAHGSASRTLQRPSEPT